MFYIIKSTFSGCILIWVSKYLYQGDHKAKAAHAKYLGLVNFLNLPMAPLVGWLFDRWTGRFLLPLAFAISGGTLMWLYFIDPLNSVFAFFLQITSGLVSLQGNNLASMTLAKFTPSEIKGAVYSLNGILMSLVGIAFHYFSGWILDSLYNKELFLIMGALGLANALLFLVNGICAPRLHEKEEKAPSSLQKYSELNDEIQYK